jgi:hypothetical protein
VNNESADILRILNASFQEIAAAPRVDLYPEALRAEIDAVSRQRTPNARGRCYDARGRCWALLGGGMHARMDACMHGACSIRRR